MARRGKSETALAAEIGDEAPLVEASDVADDAPETLLGDVSVAPDGAVTIDADDDEVPVKHLGADKDGGPDREAPESSAPASGPGPIATPAMAQYIEIKAANADCMLFYRMGDFYELFFEDAVQASQALGIALTKRGKHYGEDIPMAGVPVHAADQYLQRLIRSGFRVAVCEQMEDPAEAKRLRGYKAVVRRDVVRLVTPGTLTEDSLLDAKTANYLTALYKGRQPATGPAPLALASLDISTGDFLVGEVSEADLLGEVVRLGPSEIVVADGLMADVEIKKAAELAGAVLTPMPAPHFDSMAGERELKAKLGVAELGGFGGFSRPELSAVAGLLKYVDLTQLGKRPVLRAPRKTSARSILMIDAATRTSLELVRSTSGERHGSLLWAIDRTVTAPGARELANRLSSPLRDAKTIAARLDVTGFLLEEGELRVALRKTLRATPDMARAMARLAFQRGGPKDLAIVRDALQGATHCVELLQRGAGILGLPDELKAVQARLDLGDLDLFATLARALVEDPPLLKRDGGFVRLGFDADLDRNRELRDASRQVLARLQLKYQEETGNKALKVKHNNILGYFVEVTQNQSKPLLSEPLSALFNHRQTMANAVRFSTAELGETESEINTAAEKAVEIESRIFGELAAAIATAEARLGDLATALAEVDHYCGLAELAEEQGYVRPILDDGTAFEIRGGRHPVVEQALKKARGGAFIENDCVLGRAEPHTPGFATGEDARIWLVTGPNMAGKSTFLRQNALIAVMAQMGAYVPARSAHIGIIDRLFSRVGASDDLARGRSTFMVEMVETAGILNQATDRSLVILDEIGRGTATFDGLSIAWAVVEHLDATSRCRALFATHYHELTALAEKLPSVANATIEIKEWQDSIIFLHKVIPGSADRSYGIQVAKLAGLPPSVIARAGEVLAVLEASGQKPSPEKLLDDLPLFSAARRTETVKERPAAAKSRAPASVTPPAPPPSPSPVETALKEVNPDELTPRQALDELYRLKGMVVAKKL
jgi:DNA mismatch repair protein MutS